MNATTGKMVKNPNYTNALKYFGILGMAYGAYSALTVDKALAASYEQDLRGEVNRLQHTPTTSLEYESQRRAVMDKASRYLNLLTGDTISTETNLIFWIQYMKSVEAEFGKP